MKRCENCARWCRYIHDIRSDCIEKCMDNEGYPEWTSAVCASCNYAILPGTYCVKGWKQDITDTCAWYCKKGELPVGKCRECEHKKKTVVEEPCKSCFFDPETRRYSNFKSKEEAKMSKEYKVLKSFSMSSIIKRVIDSGEYCEDFWKMVEDWSKTFGTYWNNEAKSLNSGSTYAIFISQDAKLEAYLIEHGYIKIEQPKKTYSIGDWFDVRNVGQFVLVSVDKNEVVLVRPSDGARWGDPFSVGSPQNIKESELTFQAHLKDGGVKPIPRPDWVK